MSKSQGGNGPEVKSEESEATDGCRVKGRDLEEVGGSK